MKVNLNNDNNDYVRGYKVGKKAAAIEWAGKAQGLIDALEMIAGPLGHNDANIALYNKQQIASKALAKYKEVSK